MANVGCTARGIVRRAKVALAAIAFAGAAASPLTSTFANIGNVTSY